MKTKILLLFLLLSISFPHQMYARKLYYAEEFYLYVMNLHYINPNLKRNIRFMQWALKAPFDNPVRSLASIKTENDFNRYKALFKMHVNLLIIDSYLQLARRFDKEHIYFFNLPYAKDLQKSFAIARYYYEMSFNYWDEVIRYAELAGNTTGRISIDHWEDELTLIQTGKLDYQRIIGDHLNKLEARLDSVESYLEAVKKNDFPE